MSLMDILTAMGMIGLMILFLLVVFVPFIAVVIVSIMVANCFCLTGIYWWSAVIVIFMVLSSLISFVLK